MTKKKKNHHSLLKEMRLTEKKLREKRRLGFREENYFIYFNSSI